MKYSSVSAWLVTGVTGVVAVATSGCSSSDFGSCETKYTCPPAAAGSAGSAQGGSAGDGSAGAGGSNAGEAGSADAGSSGTGDAGTGGDVGTAGASGSGGDNAAGTAGTGGAVNGPPVLFGACNMLGALACESHASAQRLACDGNKWQAGTTCGSDMLCDSSDGSCKPVVGECAVAKPGDVVCRSGDVPLTCGPDLVSASEGTPCDGVCSDGICVAPSCGDSKLQAGEDCDDGNTIGTDACTAACKTAACGDGVVWAGHETCDDKNAIAGDGCSKACAWEPVAIDGYLHTCAIGGNGALRCWGDNQYGGLGLGDTLHRGDQANEMGAKLPAVELGTKRAVKQVAVGSYFSCALLDDGSVKCWGYNADGELGQGDTLSRGDQPGEMGDALKPVDLGTGRTAKSIGVGNYHACALLDDSTVKCWGLNSDGQLGTGNHTNVGDKPNQLGAALHPVALGSNHLVKAIAVGGYHTCAIMDDDGLKCWGANNYGQLGIGTSSAPTGLGDLLPYVYFGPRGVKAVAAGYSFTCAILSDDTLQCWGENSYGFLGTGTPQNELLPRKVELGTGRKPASIALGRVASCAVLDDGQVKCWGLGPLGLGDSAIRGDGPNEMGDQLPAIDLGANQSARQVTVGYSHMCALLAAGTVKCWGLNVEGELGLGHVSTLGDAPNEMGDQLPALSLAF